MGRSSSLRNRFKIERRVSTADGWPDTDDAWESVAEVFAAEVPLQGSELVAAVSITSTANSKVRFRWSSLLSDLNTTDRIVRVRDLVTYNIVSVKSMDNRWIELVVTKEG